jgi:hypothetical protein
MRFAVQIAKEPTHLPRDWPRAIDDRPERKPQPSYQYIECDNLGEAQRVCDALLSTMSEGTDCEVGMRVPMPKGGNVFLTLSMLESINSALKTAKAA